MKSLILLSFLMIGFFCFSQEEKMDTIYTHTERIIAKVIGISPDAVKFKYPNETFPNSLYKNAIKKVCLSSGRIVEFSEISSFKTVNSSGDWENVSITHVESEVKGLFKLGQVTSKAVGTTEFSNMNKVKDRAYKKLKIETAMLGGNILFLTNEKVEGASIGYYSGTTTYTNLSGIAYSNRRPSFDEFVEIYHKGDTLYFLKTEYLGNNSMDVQLTKFGYNDVVIVSISEDAGFFNVLAEFKDNYPGFYRVISFDENGMVLMNRDEKKVYNVFYSKYPAK